MRRAPIDATTSWRLPGTPATDGISKRTTPASADTTRAAAPPTATVTPSAKPLPVRVTSSPGRAPGGSIEMARSGSSATKGVAPDRPAPVSTTRDKAPPR